MARPLRIQYPDAVYHVTCRGNERKDIFRGDADRKKMLDILVQSLGIYGVKLYGYVLMNNHFHLLVETPLGNLGEFMRHFNVTYTGYFNRCHKRVGHLYQGRYKSILVEKASYLAVLSRYIHLNPVRIRKMMKTPVEDKIRELERYPWSSLHGYMPRGRRDVFVDYATVLDEYGGDNERARKIYKAMLYAELSSGIEIKDKIIGQSVLGRDDFVEWVRERHIDRGSDREMPAMKEVRKYRSAEDILKVIEDVTGRPFEDIAKEKGSNRQIALDLLYRFGGMKGAAVGRLFGIGYTAVSQERRRLREKMTKDMKLRAFVKRMEEICKQ